MQESNTDEADQDRSSLEQEKEERHYDKSLPVSLAMSPVAPVVSHALATHLQHHDHPASESLDDSMLTASSVASGSTVSSANTSSLALNPNSIIDPDDLPGIALLKEIFPEETTESLRELHYQHIMANKAHTQNRQQQQRRQSSSSSTHETGNARTGTTDNSLPPLTTRPEANEDYEKHSYTRPRFLNIPSVELPEDFLRLPTSVAVLRLPMSGNNRNVKGYQFLSDLQERALQEYRLAAGVAAELERDRVEFKTFAIQKDVRWGLGMTLQEEEDVLPMAGKHHNRAAHTFESAASRYGLRVVGFLPDPDKITMGEVKSSIARSPAEEAGIRLDDVVIGINGEAFLLPPLSYSLSNQQLGQYYRNQKERIISSLQQSPNPVVVHVRRQRSTLVTIRSGDRQTSLLDTTVQDIEDDSTSLQQTSSTPQMRTPQHQAPIQPVSSFDSVPKIPQFRPSTTIHPLAEALMKRKLIRSRDDQWRITFRLQHFTERTRQWEASSALRLRPTSLALIPHFDPKDLPPDMASLMVFTSDDEEVERSHTYVTVDNDCQQEVGSAIGSHPDAAERQGVFWGLKCAPSTPPLSLDSPLIPVEYLQAFYGEEQAEKVRSSSTPGSRRGQGGVTTKQSSYDEPPAARRLFQSQQMWDPFQSQELFGAFPGNRKKNVDSGSGNEQHVVWVPLYGIRKSLSARIVNSFVEESPESNVSIPARMAYTMWVYDAESGREWYAPIRYWKDFCDLREAAMALLPPSSNLQKELSSIKFPREVTIPKNSGLWNTAVFSRTSPLSPLQDRRRKRQIEEFEEARELSSRVLEEFLRELLGAVYICVPLHPNVAEVALYVQSFLGVDSGLAEDAVVFQESRAFTNATELEEETCRQMLKRSIQRYTWRIFLLHTMKAIVGDFVDAARARGPKLQDIEALEAQGRATIKSRAMEELARIQNFLDHLVDLILDGCRHDLRMISKRQDFSPIWKFFCDESYWNRLVREAVREQVEIEVYVPLRGVVSRLLVNGWRHEDMEVQFKIKELRKRPQSVFRITEDKISPSSWQSVAQILRQGVGMSTLPCVKLRAIVEAAREISRLHTREHGDGHILGADDFLPIFIYSVVRAEMERPCALCVLLRTLCDRTNRTGEIGYFLASFEAAVSHVQEIDLTEDSVEMLSFLSAPLTEISLSD